MQKNISAASLCRQVQAIIRSGDIAPHKAFLIELLSHHPSPEKVSGLRDVSLNEARNGLIITRDDGSWDTVSWKKCAARKTGGKGTSHRSLCLQAMRYAVVDQTTTFRREHGFLGKGRDFHVGHDHESGEAFVELAERFVRQTSAGDWEGMAVHKSSHRTPQGNLPWVLSSTQAQAWRDFHANEAKLRMETAEDNLRSSK